MNNERFRPEQINQDLLILLESELDKLSRAYHISTDKEIRNEYDAENLEEAVRDFLENIGNAIGHNNPALAELQQVYIDTLSENEKKADDEKLKTTVKHFVTAANAVINDIT